MASATSSRQVYGFLQGVQQRTPSATLSDADLASLAQLHLIDLLTADQYRSLQGQVATLDSARAAVATGQTARSQTAAAVRREQEHARSILFHFEGQAHRAADLDREARDEAMLRAEDADLQAKAKALSELVRSKSMLDTAVPLGDRYVALTGLGVLQIRDLGLRLYRVGDLPFSAYWNESQKTTAELEGIAAQAAQFDAGFVSVVPGADRSALWAASIGLAKLGGDATAAASRFVDAYGRLRPLAPNPENLLLSSEIVAAVPRAPADLLPAVAELDRTVRSLGVSAESALGVAALLVFAQRQDGTYATDRLKYMLQGTRCFEAAALLAIVNRPLDDLASKFVAWRGLFASWGYVASEDEELASAFLTVSELPLDGTTTKLAIVRRGLATYLQYPLVASAILAAIPVLEANETLNLLEQAYEIIGRRAMPMSQAELLCLAVRMVHGIRPETVGNLDATAPTPPAGLAYAYGPRFFFVPVILAHGAYYSSFGGISGAHPAHVHAMGGAIG